MARSACHFFTSSGLFIAVDNSISRSRAWRGRTRPRRGIAFSRDLIPW